MWKIKENSNVDILNKIADRIELCNPKDVFIHSGSEEDSEYVKKMCLETGEETDLAMEGHTIHFDLKEEQGRIIDRTFYISNEGEEVNSLANKMDRGKACEDVKDKMTGIMKGKIICNGKING